MRPAIAATLTLLTLMLTACSGGGDSARPAPPPETAPAPIATPAPGPAPAPGANGPEIELLTLMRIDPEPAGGRCSTPGILVSRGADANGNGELDPAEIAQREPVCAYAGLLPAHTDPPPVNTASLMQPEAAKANAAALERYRASRSIQFSLGLPDWPVPTNPTWRENPFASNSWQFYYQSLVWLWAPIKLYEATGDSAYLDDLRRYTIGWVAANPTVILKTWPWYDHAVAYRAEMLAYIYHHYLRDRLSAGEREQLFDSLARHGAELVRLVQDPTFFGHNHNMFHSLALYNLSRAFPA